MVVDNYATHKHPDVEAWLARHRRVTLHFTPTSGSWLNLVEVFFSIITRQAIRRGTFVSVKELVGAIRLFIDGWNERCYPFTWTKAPDEVLSHARPRKRTSNAEHSRNQSLCVADHEFAWNPTVRCDSLQGSRRLDPHLHRAPPPLPLAQRRGQELLLTAGWLIGRIELDFVCRASCMASVEESGDDAE